MLVEQFLDWVFSKFTPSQQWLWDRLGDAWNWSTYQSWFLARQPWQQIGLAGIYLAVAIWLVWQYMRDKPKDSVFNKLMQTIAMFLWGPIMIFGFSLLTGTIFYGLWLAGASIAIAFAVVGFIFEIAIRSAGLLGR